MNNIFLHISYVSVPLEHEYVGCYVDEANRKLKGFFKSGDNVTPRNCINRCRDLLFKYAGLQYG